MARTIAIVVALFALLFNVSVVIADILPLTEYIFVGGQRIKLEDGLDLSQRDLRGIEIHRELRTLKNINFSGSNLQGADFSETRFVNCSFRGARLIDITCLHADKNCDFTDASIRDIRGLSITREQLESTANFKRRQFLDGRKHLKNILFSGSDLRGTVFSEFVLEGVGFIDSLVDDCDFTNTVLEGKCGFGGVYTGLPYVVGGGGSVDPTKMTYEQLQSTKNYKDGVLVNLRLHLICTEGQADFSRMNLTGCQFSPEEGWHENCRLDLTDAIITNCDFRWFKRLTLENVKSTWNYKNNRLAGVWLPEEIQKVLDAEKEQ